VKRSARRVLAYTDTSFPNVRPRRDPADAGPAVGDGPPAGRRTTRDPSGPDAVSQVPHDWLRWLSQSSTPPPRDEGESRRLFHVSGGVIVDPAAWPRGCAARIYVAYGDKDAVYCGQTRRPLAERVREHFGPQLTPDQQLKAGTWRFVVTAVFDDLTDGQLDALESHAARWLVPLRQLRGRRHPRQR